MYKIRVRVGAGTTPFYSCSGWERGSFSMRSNFFFSSPSSFPLPVHHHYLLSILYHSFFYCTRAWIQRLSRGIFLAWKTACLLLSFYLAACFFFSTVLFVLSQLTMGVFDSKRYMDGRGSDRCHSIYFLRFVLEHFAKYK